MLQVTITLLYCIFTIYMCCNTLIQFTTYICGYTLIWGCRGCDCMVVGFITTYICNQCLSPLQLWVRILLRRSVLDTTLCDEVCQW